MKLTEFFKWVMCCSFVVYLLLSAFSKVDEIFVPSFEMTVSPDLAQVVKHYDGLLQIGLKYNRHDIVQNCDTSDFVMSSASRGIFLADEIEYNCGNEYSSMCPNMSVEYRDETTVFVSGVYALRSHYSFSQVQECARNVIMLGRFLKKYVDVGVYNKRTYGDL